MHNWNFASARVPVTGAAGGMGLAICRKLRDAGATPLLLDVDSAALATALTQVYGDTPEREHYGYVVDVRCAQSVDACFERIRAEHGLITHAVANAGINIPAHALDITDAQWHQVMEVNLHGVMYLCRAAARHLAQGQGRGALVNVASIAGLRVKPQRIAYTSSKAAVIHMTRALALDLGEHGVRVNAVAPGIIQTPMQAENAADAVAAIAQRTALGRTGTTEEVANAVLFLLSDLASYVTGHTLLVDGGLTLNYA